MTGDTTQTHPASANMSVRVSPRKSQTTLRAGMQQTERTDGRIRSTETEDGEQRGTRNARADGEADMIGQ